MPNSLVQAGAVEQPTAFAPLSTSRIFTGLWTNRSFLRDAATSYQQERWGLGRQDSILDGYNSEITPRLTLMRRPGSTVYNANILPPVKRFYSFNTFTLTDESIRVLADTPYTIFDVTDNGNTTIFQKSAGARSAYFQGVGNTLYFTDGLENMQWNYETGFVGPWGLNAPATAPTISQRARPNTFPSWQPNTAYQVSSDAISGIFVLDDLTNIPENIKIIPTQNNGEVAVVCGQNFASGSSISLPDGFDTTRLFVWVTPGYGYDPVTLPPGVYQSFGTGGVVNASFQNRSGGLGFGATANWIAVAWTATAGISFYQSGNYQGISFITAAGAHIALQFGTGADLSQVYIPSGMSGAQALHMAGMVSSDNVDHTMQGVWQCTVDGTGTIHNLYDDGSGNTWHGNTGVFSVFWGAGNTTTSGVTNGTALNIPTSGVDSVVMIFAVVPKDASFGLPSGWTLSQFVETCAMNGHAGGGGNRAHGWSCLLNGQTFAGFVMDSEGHQWNATGNVFAVGSVTSASGGNVQWAQGTGTTGSTEPAWNQTVGGTTPDGSVTWTNLGPARWQPGITYNVGQVVMGVVVSPPNTPNQLFVCTTPGLSGTMEPRWSSSVGTFQTDGSVVWQCLGRALSWSDVGAGVTLSAASTIVDSNGFKQTVWSAGTSGTAEPTWQTELGALTDDNTMQWKNAGPFAVAMTAPVKYGYSYVNSSNTDQSNMSPASVEITIGQGGEAVVQGQGTGQAGVDKIWLWRTVQGGSTYFYLDAIDNPGEGQVWTYEDNIPDSGLNNLLQSANAGENTPLEVGATCLGYHLSRIWAAVGNVVWVSAGPDAVNSGSNGNVGFNTSFTLQSKITRFWACSLGMMVFTVRDCYLIQGTATTNDPLYAITFVENLPLLSYDCFSVNKTTPYLLLGNQSLISLDPSAGINEVGFPIADRLIEEFNAATSYVTFHHGNNLDLALYVANGTDHWYRMSLTNAPESGLSWSPRAEFSNGIGCVQSVETSPGVYSLLISSTSEGPILQRDQTDTIFNDNGTNYPVMTRFGSIVLAVPGQLAAIGFITLESMFTGSRASLGMLLGEAEGTFEFLSRTRQDPTNLPPSASLYSDRYYFAQNQRAAWCRHFQMEIAWPAEDFPNELLTFTVFGQTWAEKGFS